MICQGYLTAILTAPPDYLFLLSLHPFFFISFSVSLLKFSSLTVKKFLRNLEFLIQRCFAQIRRDDSCYDEGDLREISNEENEWRIDGAKSKQSFLFGRKRRMDTRGSILAYQYFRKSSTRVKQRNNILKVPVRERADGRSSKADTPGGREQTSLKQNHQKDHSERG